MLQRSSATEIDRKHDGIRYKQLERSKAAEAQDYISKTRRKPGKTNRLTTTTAATVVLAAFDDGRGLRLYLSVGRVELGFV
jgi:hypothetical protein